MWYMAVVWYKLLLKKLFNKTLPTYIFAVLRLGEVDEVIVVHVLSVEKVTVLLLAEVVRVDTIGP